MEAFYARIDVCFHRTDDLCRGWGLSGGLLQRRNHHVVPVLQDDIHRHGSHNAGLTNFYRVYGKKFAICVILVDMLKAYVAVKLGSAVFDAYLGLRLEGEYFSALFCVIGHIFPAFYSFKGGKGILCSGTLLLLLDWRIAAVGWGLFALLWLTTRYVSLGSVSGAVSFPVTTLIFCPGNWTVFVLSLLIAALVIWAHRENISRLLHGTESRFRWHTDAP